MPYPNVLPSKTADMDSCVAQVMAEQGLSKERAVAICYTSIVEGRESHFIEATLRPTEAKGKEWAVTIIGASSSADIVEHRGKEYVRSKNGRLYACDALRDSVPMWEGVQVFDNHLTDEEFEKRAGMRSILAEGLGAIVSPAWDAKGRKLTGVLKIADDKAARKLLNYHEAGILDTIGLSIDTIPQSATAIVEGKRQPLIEGFDKIFSVDLVAEPAAGGGFNRLIAATQHQEAEMADLASLEARVAALESALASGSAEQVEETSEEVVAEIEDVVEEVAATAPPEADPGQVAQAIATEVQAVADEIAGEAPEELMEESERIAQLESRVMLNEKLASSKLPSDGQKIVKEAFAGKIASPQEVDRMVENLRGALAARDASGQVRGAGASRVSVGMNGDDWKEVEFLRLLTGNTKFRALEAIEDPITQERMPESYKAWVKSGRQHGNERRISEWLYHGFGDPYDTRSRFREAATTSSLSSIVKNAVNVILAADFQARHQWWAPIVREEEVDTIDAPTLVRWFGLGNLDVVDEGQAYTEKALVDEEETAAFVKRGNYVGVTLETFLRDKVNKLRSIPELLADSWYNTLSNLVATVFTVNTNAGPLLVGSAGNLFNATATTSSGGHANLLTSPLSFSAYDAARTAMRKQQSGDAGTGPKLLITPKYLLVPVDLERLAHQIVDSPLKPGGADNDVNPWQNESQVIVVPEWTDANNWALVGDSTQYPCIWVIYHRGNRVPELFTADDETAGAMFTNDTLRYKVRQLSFRYSSTYDCAPVSDWRGLHKNNVA